ncbi:MAG: HPr family phosphocarrier protein [Gammaproteobacteria bacterium]|nr:HPr family phosphocarrier protein [Gammaproteobacteria bacterium]
MQLERNIKIINKLGMHARAAAKFVKLASTFQCQIEIERNGRRVNGKSIMGVMMLAASKGSDITIFADGDDATEGLDQLEELINNRFDEDE